MLNSELSTGSFSFQMGVAYTHTISISLVDLSSHLFSISEKKVLIFIDPVVLSHQDHLLALISELDDCHLVPTTLHEQCKDFDSLTAILNIMESQGIGRRDDHIIAVGGGALLDVVAFAASIFRRGINVVKVPTTLLGIVDASIGIKTGINFLGQRNRIGSYHFNYDVLIDPSMLTGLHPNQVRHGLGELFKIAIIKSRSLFYKLSLHKSQLEDVDFFSTESGLSIIAESVQLMLEELHDNPREENLMRAVDFGHSFSPLVEMESLKNPSYRSLPHGFAVAYDCALTTTISYLRGILPPEDYSNIINLFFSFDFDFSNCIYEDHNLLWSSFLEMVRHRGGSQNLPIPISIGAYTFIQDLSYSELSNAILYLSSSYN